jgi:hypothetical protein
MKKQATPEQKAAKAARRERFRAMVKQVAAVSNEERAAIVARAGAVLTCEGRALSPVNTCLLMQQMPDASLVGGFRQWLKAGRAVKKGHHGAMIWVPVRKAEGKMQNAEIEEEEETKGEMKSRTNFIIGTVFDISQTDELTAEQKARSNPQSAIRNPQSQSDDMRFDPTNPTKVPAMVPVPRPPRKRGQQVIPPAPQMQKAECRMPNEAKLVDLDSIVFEPAAPQSNPPNPQSAIRNPQSDNIIKPNFQPAPAQTAIPRWRRMGN